MKKREKDNIFGVLLIPFGVIKILITGHKHLC